MEPWFKRRKKLEFYETLLAELRLEHKYRIHFITFYYEQLLKTLKKYSADKGPHN